MGPCFVVAVLVEEDSGLTPPSAGGGEWCPQVLCTSSTLSFCRLTSWLEWCQMIHDDSGGRIFHHHSSQQQRGTSAAAAVQ